MYSEVVVEDIGEINIDHPGEYLEQELLYTPDMALTAIKLGLVDWDEAESKYFNLMNHSVIGNLIRDGLYIAKVQQEIDEKRDFRQPTQSEVDQFLIENPSLVKEDLVDRPDTWVDLYRRHHAHLEEIAARYSEGELASYESDIGLGLIARETANELLLEQTQPVSEARSFLNIDGYTGIEDEPDENYIRIPDVITLPDAEGNLVAVSMMELKRDFSYPGNFRDPDHEWEEDEDPDDLPSVPIWQMKHQEYAITPQYYELVNRYRPAIKLLESQVHNDPLYKIADRSNKLWVENFLYEILEKSILVQAIEKGIRQLLPDYDIQDIAALAMSFPCNISVSPEVDRLIEDFGDDILDSIPDTSAAEREEWEWEEDIDFYSKETMRLMDKVADNNAIKTSAVFNREAVNGIVHGNMPVSEACDYAYKTWRETISPAGSAAYRDVLKETGNLSSAMKAFYKKAKETGDFVARDRIVGAGEEHLSLLTATSSYTQFRQVSWKVAKMKLDANELYIPPTSPDESVEWLSAKLKAVGATQAQLDRLKQ